MLGSAMGLGLLAGIRLYATVFTLGLAIRMGWFHLSSSFSSLDVLAETPILALSGVLARLSSWRTKSRGSIACGIPSTPLSDRLERQLWELPHWAPSILRRRC